MNRLEGLVVIVTGAAQGPKASLGASIAIGLAREGASVVAADVADCSFVVEIIHANGGRALAVDADVSEENDIAALMRRTVDRFGPPQVLVNNAAYGSNIPPVSLTDLSVAEWDKAMAVNLRGPFLCARAVVPFMVEVGWGKIVNIGSATAYEGLPERLHYVTSKGGVHAMTRSLARELGQFGIRVNSVSPGLVMNASVAEMMRGREHVLEHVLGSRAIASDIGANDVVSAVTFLASPESDGITGQSLIVDHGGIFL